MRMPERPWSRFRVRASWCCSRSVVPVYSARAFAGDADQKTQAAREQFFEQNVRPLLAQNCYSCHGDKKQKGGLRLDSIEAILKGGESGPAVVPGKPDESLLVRQSITPAPRCPPTASSPRESRRPHALGFARCPMASRRPSSPCDDRFGRRSRTNRSSPPPIVHSGRCSQFACQASRAC